jgi:tetratricopeptide (TPR) repeat protein
MSLHLAKTESKLANYALRYPQAANTARSVFSKISLGYFKPTLSTTALELSQLIKPDDVLTIQGGKVTKGDEVIYANKILFEGITIDRIKVEEKMCSTEGMASYLRWEIFHKPSHIASHILPLLGNISVFYLINRYNSLVGSSDLFHDLISDSMYLWAISLYLPLHRLGPFNNQNIQKMMRLENVMNLEIKTYRFSDTGGMAVGHADALAGAIFLDGSLDGSVDHYSGAMIHEKAHILGASEYTARRIVDEYTFFKLRASNAPIYKYIPWFFFKFFQTFRSNILEVAYSLRGQKYHRGFYNELAFPIYDREELTGFVQELEKGQKECDDLTAAVCFRMIGDHAKAMRHYQAFIDKYEGMIDPLKEPAYASLYLAIALTQLQLGNIPGARIYLERIPELKGKYQVIYLAAQTELKKIYGLHDE